MQERVKTIQGTGLAAGRLFDLGTRRRETWTDAGGTAELEVLNQGFALLLNNIMGANGALTQVGTTTAYQLGGASGISLGAPDNQNYLSMQALVPNTAGTIFQQNFHGCKFTKATFSIDMQSPLTVQLDIDSQQVTTAEAAGTPSYTANTRTFTFQGMNFKVGAFGSEASIDGVRKMTCTIERGMEVNRIYMGQSAKAEPVSNAVVKISGTADLDLTAADKSVFWDLYHSQNAVPSIVMDFVGNAIGTSGKNDELILNPTNVFIDSGGTPELDGPGITQTTLNWSALIDSSNDAALIAKLTTADTTL